VTSALRDGGLCFTKNGVSISTGNEEMIYLQNTQEAQVVYIPRNGVTPQGDLVFKAKNTINLEEEIDVHVLDLQVSDLYYYLAVTLPEKVTDGEYEYTLSSEGDTLSTGLLVVGDYSKPNEYDKVITYEQYETE
jgi:hypothetical protein